MQKTHVGRRIVPGRLPHDLLFLPAGAECGMSFLPGTRLLYDCPRGWHFYARPVDWQRTCHDVWPRRSSIGANLRWFSRGPIDFETRRERRSASFVNAPWEPPSDVKSEATMASQNWLEKNGNFQRVRTDVDAGIVSASKRIYLVSWLLRVHMCESYRLDTCTRSMIVSIEYDISAWDG